MKLHDLRPAAGSKTVRTRVGRGIAAGKGKTAGRGTKGQKARAGGSIPPWFEGGQTPLHRRIPKLRGFKNRFKVEYEVVNVGAIAQRVDAGAFAEAGTAPKKGEQLTINADVLRAVGLVRNVKKPLKVLGAGELSAALFVVADAFTRSAIQKIEAAGGAVSVLEVPAETRAALGVGDEAPRTAREPRTAAGRAAADRRADARAARAADTAEIASQAAASDAAKQARAPKEAAESAEAKAPKAPKAAKETRAPKPKGSARASDVSVTDEPVDPTGEAEPIADAPDAADAVADAPDAVDGPSGAAAGSPDDAAASDLGTDETAGSSADRTAEADTDTAAADDESA
jgi:large subunit ribosomal protein L15